MIANSPSRLFLFGSGDTFIFTVKHLLKKKSFHQNIYYIETEQNNQKVAETSFGIDYINKKEFLSKIKTLDDCLILSFSIPFKIPRSHLDKLKIGIVNFHASLLPNYRGMHPLNWSIINGEKKIGVTAHWMDSSLDTGPIIDQEIFELELYDDINTVKKKTNRLIANMSNKMIDQFLSDGFIKRGRVQKSSPKNFYAKRRAEIDSRLRIKGKSSMEIYNFCRALYSPYPNSFFLRDGFLIKIKKVMDIIYNHQNDHYLHSFLTKSNYEENILFIDDNFIIIRSIDGFLICKVIKESSFEKN